jgi:hypothetical protein
MASYAGSLLLKGGCARTFCNSGYTILKIGLIAALHGTLIAMAWIANPLLLAAWVLLAIAARKNRSYRSALLVSVIAMILALSSLLVREINIGDLPPLRVSGVGLGYWLWIASVGWVICGAVMGMRSRRDATQTSSSSPP